MKQASTRLAMGAALALSIACGGGTPTSTILPSPVPVPTTTPTPAPAPTPDPTPTPCTQGLCEPKVVNDSPAARLTVRLYTIEDGLGNFISNPDPNEGIRVGAIARIDATAKDEDGKETNGLGSIEFFFSDSSLVKIGGGNGPQQRKLKVLKSGRLVCWAVLDGIQSNLLTLYFTN
ncbi:MAG TPA: hypothetical protein VK132_12015 [Gemmatimonadales bacterium]|nr:hypothetical protein [Gemmatimonadales bacterium]